ncbi:transporter substrate-binding domain-containing protein [Pseudoduganella sp. DS3]|uniref:Transporter substrate-binding domain-containing protein n=1 Tax=Pseudoduganella guangdongensis TaxID=2692179 RepID=A0A6N9HM44_9BURK|nr:transporter substrate-binding domain-containing protein [Pseudoduganella guangdongensis]MYN04446.1 transporter substrate-binding domain-containing protein [Pseudoduganella guangdongensis]
MRRAWILALLAAMLAALVLPASAGPTITIGAEDDWAPYSSGPDGHARGFAVDVVREAYALAGVAVHFKALPYSRCMAETRAGRLLACFDAVPNSLIAPHYLWPQQPLFSTHMNIYARAGSPERNLRVRDLEGRTVGVQREYEYGEAFDVNSRIVRHVVDKNEHGFRMLLAGRIDYMAAEARIADALFRSKPAEFAGRFALVGTVATPQVFIAFSKDAPNSRAMLALFNQGYAKLRKSPRYKELQDKWLK